MSLETLPNPEFYPDLRDWANALIRELRSEPEPSLNSDSISAFDESAQDAVAAALTDTATVDFTYDDALHQISAIVPNDSISNAKLANMAQATFKMRAAAAGTGDPIDGTAAQAKTALAITAADLSDFAEAVQDTVGAAAADSTTIDFTYDDGAGTLTADVKADSITYALMQNVSATARFLGRITAGAGDIEELTGTQATTLLDVFTSALQGLAPASGGGTDNFLRADGTWDEPPGTGGGGASYDAGPPGTVPAVGTLTAVNAGTATASDGTDGIALVNDNDNEVHIWNVAAPAAPFDVYMRLESAIFSSAAQTAALGLNVGIVLRDNTNGDFLECVAALERVAGDEQTSYSIVINRWTNPTTFSATALQRLGLTPYEWLHVNVTSTTVTLEFSVDGKAPWSTIGTETIATFVGTIDRYGICIRGAANNSNSIAKIAYFSTTPPS